MKLFNTLHVDKSKFNTTWLLGTTYIALVFILFLVFGSLFGSVSQKILSYSNTPSIADLTNQDVSSILGILWFIIFSIVVFVILQLVAYAFFEHTIWNVIFGKKTTVASSAKFLGFSVLLAALLAIVDIVAFIIISFLPQSLVKVGVGLFYLIATFSIYVLFIGFALFTKSHIVFATIPKTFKIGFNIQKMGVPFIIAAVIMLAVNAVIIVFTWLPAVAFSVLTAVLFAAYLAWFRLYVANALKSVKF